MDTTQKVSASTITGFLQSEDENTAMPQCAEGKRPTRSQQSAYLREQQQLYPPPPAYYPYYPPPLPMAPSMSYYYAMDLIKHMSMHSDIRNYLPKFDDLPAENKPKEESKTESKPQRDVQKDCNHSHHTDASAKMYSHLCVSCEQHLRCSCCSKPLKTDNDHLANNHLFHNCLQCLLPLHSPLHFHPNQVLSCNCACQKQTETKSKRKPKHKAKKNKCNQMCSQPEQIDIPERDRPFISAKRGQNSKSTYCKEDSQESSSEEDCSILENQSGDYQSDEGRRGGFYAGEGDKNKISARTQKSDLPNNRVRKTRRSLAYFINV